MFKKSFDFFRNVFAAAAAVLTGKDATPSNLLDLKGFGADRRGCMHAGQTKRGPGRKHYEGKPNQRRKPAVHGGNWQGLEYLTYMEHDAVTRSYFSMPSIPRDDPFHLWVLKDSRPK
mgnify:FL=1